MATCFSILAWRILWTGEPSGLQSDMTEVTQHTHNIVKCKPGEEHGTIVVGDGESWTIYYAIYHILSTAQVQCQLIMTIAGPI